MATNMVRNAPMVMGALQKNILEHISLMAQEQVQLEFREQLMHYMISYLLKEFLKFGEMKFIFQLIWLLRMMNGQKKL